jgi:hypothetical protein
MAVRPRLNTRLLIRRDDIVVRPQRPTLPAPLIQIKNWPGALGESRVARKGPAGDGARAEWYRCRTAPQRRATDRGDQPTGEDFSTQVGQRPARQARPASP